MLVKKNSLIKTPFCKGRVVKVIDGRDYDHLRDTFYYEVKIDRPWCSKPTVHVVRFDEIVEVK